MEGSLNEIAKILTEVNKEFNIETACTLCNIATDIHQSRIHEIFEKNATVFIYM